jgi:hypothetical protein
MEMAIKCLIEAVEKVLRDGGLGRGVEEVYLKSSAIEAARAEPLEKQRAALNTFWMQQLQSCQVRTGENTMDARFCLVDSGAPEIWLKLFKSEVLPVAIRHKLPIS